LVRSAPAAGSLRRRLEEAARLIEIDETYVGGIEANKHEHKKLKQGRGTVGKTAVLGMKERGKGGRVKAVKIDVTPTRRPSKT
jgi:hypothetical protein